MGSSTASDTDQREELGAELNDQENSNFSFKNAVKEKLAELGKNLKHFAPFALTAPAILLGAALAVAVAPHLIALLSALGVGAVLSAAAGWTAAAFTYASAFTQCIFLVIQGFLPVVAGLTLHPVAVSTIGAVAAYVASALTIATTLTLGATFGKDVVSTIAKVPTLIKGVFTSKPATNACDGCPNPQGDGLGTPSRRLSSGSSD